MCPRQGASKLFLLIIAVSLTCSAFFVFTANADAVSNASAVSFKRPSVEKIRSETHDILNNPKFAPRKSFMQWIAERLGDWEFNMPKGLSFVGRGLYWIILIGSVITVLSFLGYLIYRVIKAIQTRSSKSFKSEVFSGEIFDVTRLNYEELRARMEESARKGDYKNAIRYMMLALLRWLDANRILTFHESKTNGDYLCEFTPLLAAAEHFRQFVKRFDYSVYGGLELSNNNYDDMNDLYSRVCKDVSTKS